MKLVSEFRDSRLAQGLAAQIRRQSRKPVRLMEFCGGHTTAIFRHGLRKLLPAHINMVSGPGCPICVTANADLDKAIALSRVPGVIIATFGDMMKVPASHSSLQEAKSEGADVRLVYSPQDALRIAVENPGRAVVFIAVGFETTAPAVAASIMEAEKQGVGNYHVLSLHKLCPPVISALLASGEVRIDGLICPGHVSTVTGSRIWEFVAREYAIACVISGFEPLDILQTIAMLIEQIEKGEARVETAYLRAVKPEGNFWAQKILAEVFEPAAADWRAMGSVAESGLKIRKKYAQFDAETIFEIKTDPPQAPQGCLCGDILRGVKTPLDCPLFGLVCRPPSPVGPCMVSSEGTCSAYYLYGEDSHVR